MAMTCPKCSTAQPEADACRRCGLAARHFATFAPAPIDPPSEGLATAWRNVLAAWEDTKRHDAFIAIAQAQDRLDFAAACYKHSDRPGATEGLQRIRTIAALTMMGNATPPVTRKSTPATLAAAAVLGLVIVGIIIFVMRLRSR